MPLMRTDAQRPDPADTKAMIQSVPIRRLGDPLSDAGSAAVFLSCAGSAYPTGMNFMLDGGH